MSRYIILLILNLPLILLAIISAITQYKLGHSSRRRFITQLIMWLIVLVGLASAQLIYQWLYNSHLTDAASLNLFDVVEITAIVIVYFIVNRTRTRLESVEKRLRDLHTEISIDLSTRNN